MCLGSDVVFVCLTRQGSNVVLIFLFSIVYVTLDNFLSPDFVSKCSEASPLRIGSSIWATLYRCLCVHASFYFYLSCISISYTLGFLCSSSQFSLWLMTDMFPKGFGLDLNNNIGCALACRIVKFSPCTWKFGFLWNRSSWILFMDWCWTVLSDTGMWPTLLEHQTYFSNLKLCVDCHHKKNCSNNQFCYDDCILTFVDCCMRLDYF